MSMRVIVRWDQACGRVNNDPSQFFHIDMVLMSKVATFSIHSHPAIHPPTLAPYYWLKENKAHLLHISRKLMKYLEKLKEKKKFPLLWDRFPLLLKNRNQKCFLHFIYLNFYQIL